MFCVVVDLDPASVIGKVMVVLHAFGPEDHGVGFAELQRRTRLPKATLHRVASDLVSAGLLDRVDSDFHLGSHLFELGMRASIERTLVEVAAPFMEDLYERTHEIVHLGVRNGSDVLYLAKVAGHRGARAPSRVGGRMPVYATALGKALLAHAPESEQIQVLTAPMPRRTPRTITTPGRLRQQLDRVVETGVAFEHEEAAIGVLCVSAPVLGPDGRPVAAISIAGRVTRFRPSDHVAPVLAAAAGIAATLARCGEASDAY
ncbi:IclR family transcriptional regulator [Rhodococcus sp. ACS1]|uniref:IclR family transcriptional regulator n=1 Tax=Rhodococcus sp. ACS1 TaxID=2028570 RepID=UPI000BB0DB60|nr:IclR family transcriptional regulator [Rhodococcus sp. ACS1]PBC53109.1 IclR family transcriptional regulator [Rhodococcus sp. ACS1]